MGLVHYTYNVECEEFWHWLNKSSLAGLLLGIIMLVIEIVAHKSFGVNISKFYETVPADANSAQMCYKCGIDLNLNH